MHSLVRKLKFGLGVLLALWPVAVAAFVPADVLAGFDLNTLLTNRQPLAVFCVAALVSEVLAVVLFFRARVFPKDSLTSWSVVAAVAAGACTLAFLIAAVANVMHVL